MTWANQIRILQMNIQAFGGTVGQGIISAILPAVKALNILIGSLMRAANAFRTFMYVLTGTKMKSITAPLGNMSEDVEDVSTGVGDIGDAGGKAAKGIGKAEKAAKKLKKTLDLLPFDEINKLSDKTDTPSTKGTGGSGGGAGGAGGVGGLGNLALDADWGKADKSAEKLVNKWASAIRKAFLAKNWDSLGKVLAAGVNKGIYWARDKVSWANLGDGITGLTKAVTETFNSFVGNVNWRELGNAIGNGLNTMVNTANQLIGNGGVKFKSIGKAISQTILGVIRSDIDFKEVGKLIGNVLNKTPKIVAGFVTDFAKSGGWKSLGQAIGNAISGAVETVDIAEWGDTFGKVVSGIASTLYNAMDTATKNGSFTSLGTKLSDGINNVFKNFPLTKLGVSLSSIANGIVSTLSSTIAGTDFNQIGTDLYNGINSFFENFDFEATSEAIDKLTDGLITVIGSGIKAINDNRDKLGKFISDLPWAEIISEYITIKATMFTLKAEALQAIATGIAKSILKDKKWNNVGDAVAYKVMEAVSGFTGVDIPAYINVLTSVKDLLKPFADKTIGFIAKIVNSPASVLREWLGEDSLIFKLVAKITGYDDAITDKNLKDFNATINDTVDDITKRALGGFVAQIVSQNSDKLTQRDLDDIIAILTNTEDDIPTKRKKIYDVIAGMNSVEDEIPQKKKVIPGFIGWLLGLNSKKIPKDDKQISLSAKLTQWVSKWNALPEKTKEIKAKATEWASGGWQKLSSKVKDIKAKATSWAGSWQSLPSKIKDIKAKATSWAGTWQTLSTPIKNIKAKATSWASDWNDLGIKTVGVKAKITEWASGGLNSLAVALGIKHAAKGGVYRNGKWENVQKFAGGGLPNKGQLFIARESGPELVSKIGSRTSVMNNDQIVSSVSAGVYQAVSGAIAPLVANMAQNNQTGDIAVYVGGKQVTDVVIKQINQRTKMTGVSPILI